MKFEETGNIITIHDTNKCFVYFLLDNGEVVYVGQTTNGLSRPFSHYDKKFDTVKAMPCPFDMLDWEEDKYIAKYKPKYNKCRNYNVVYSLQRVRNSIRYEFDMPKFNLPALKKIMKELEIVPFVDEYTNSASIYEDQYCKIYHYLVGEQDNA